MELDREAVAQQLEDMGNYRQAEAFRNCHEKGQGWVAYCSQDPSHFHQFIPRSCNLRICPICAKNLAYRLRSKYDELIQRMYVPASWSFKHVILTAKREADLAAQLKEGNKAVRKLYKRLWGRRKGAGAIVSFEVGESGNQVHWHLLILGPYYKQALISDIWNELTGNPVVWVTKVERDRVSEILKYVTKGLSELSPDEAIQIYLALKGQRRVRTFGCFYGVKVLPEPMIKVCPVCGARLAYMPEPLWMQEHQFEVLLERMGRDPPDEGVFREVFS